MNRTNYDLLEYSKERVTPDCIKWLLVYFDKGSGVIRRLIVFEANDDDTVTPSIMSDRNLKGDMPTANPNAIAPNKVTEPDANNTEFGKTY